MWKRWNLGPRLNRKAIVKTVEPPAESNGGTEQGRALSPEEVAREFLREGRVVAVEEQNAEGRLAA